MVRYYDYMMKCDDDKIRYYDNVITMVCYDNMIYRENMIKIYYDNMITTLILKLTYLLSNHELLLLSYHVRYHTMMY